MNASIRSVAISLTLAALLFACSDSFPPSTETEAPTTTSVQSESEAPAEPQSSQVSDATPARPESPTAIVLQPDEGEVLLLRRPGGGKVTIKVDPQNTGSMRVAMGTQQMSLGYRIPLHRHEHQDEIIFVHQGKGKALLDQEEVDVEPGTTIYIPRGVWHGVENTSDEEAEIIWVVAPPGLENFFREAGAPPGAEAEYLTPEQMEEINRKHGITVRAR